MKKFILDIDITGACNLRCPCCPQGNLQDFRLPRGFMPPELLEKILAKAKSEVRVERCSLFSWGEPLLHPQLPELLRITQRAGFASYLSSNLNILPQAEAIMAENPGSFRISLSGFSQQSYGYTHRGGDIEKVKRHMEELAAAKERTRADTRIYVYYHRYRHNLQEEPLLRAYAHRLGFGFEPVWALFFPVEKILSYLGDAVEGFAVTAEDRQLIDHLAVPLDQALAAGRRHRELPCPLRDEALSLDSQGNVQLCCGVFDPRRFTLGSYLELPLAEIQRMREQHPMCRRCMAQGVHRYLIHGLDELSELALANLAAEDAEAIGLRREMAQRRRRRQLARIYDTLFSRLLPAEQKGRLAERLQQLERALGRLRRR